MFFLLLKYYKKTKFFRAQRKIQAPLNPNLPVRNTVKNYSMNLAQERQQSFQSKIPEIFELSPGCVSVDYGERLNDYLCVVLHAVQLENNKLSLLDVLIGFESTVGDKDHDTVWKNIVDSVGKLGITEEMLKRMIGVSDEGSNFVKCLAEKLKSCMLKLP